MIKKIFSRYSKLFKSGAPLERFYPMFEMVESFFYGTPTVAPSSPHVRDSLDTKRYMIIVVLALIPSILWGMFNVGYQYFLSAGEVVSWSKCLLEGAKVVLPIYLVTFTVGGFWEVIFAVFRRHEINEGFLVTGALFPLVLPPTIALWKVAVGISFAVVIAKEVFGGTGRNFINPALAGRAFLFFSYPAFMSGEVWIKKGASIVSDAVSGATPLAVAAASTSNVVNDVVSASFTLKKLFFGLVPGSIGEVSVLCALIGAAILIVTGVGSWRTMLGCVFGCVFTALAFNTFSSPDTLAVLSLPPLWHLTMGGFAFGAVFMATDPVSSPSLGISKLVYGFFIGALTVIIRCANPAYPEGVMLAILLMNVFAPLIDHIFLTRSLSKRIPNTIA